MHRSAGHLPIHDAARRAIAHAGHVLLDDIHHVEDDISKLTGHARYDHQQTPDSTEPPMSLISTLEDDFAEVRDKVEEFAASKLPAALGDVKKLEGNPVVDALLSATHVPQSALDGVVSVIQALADAFPKDGNATASEPTTVTDEPQPVAAGPVVAGQA